ncbi:glycosyltransferase [Providencia stuartii]|uniref:glycosyltransferase n=1 Tax=Providencia TaxID=586 RepID=UPI000DE4A77B|nr:MULTISPECIES: glycosyltransferase [Providencia]EMD1718124.1 glycosyltransferase [Providencia stuartii]MBG5908328.1 glycosyltransferase [Providencia stuartii]MTC67361.1 glycosyltransferase [Providencia stuartii]WAZ74714.1 glycosyltransferase [Providencia stuartii]HAU5776226.1 glycosyltransferase [Providencia stuartii]
MLLSKKTYFAAKILNQLLLKMNINPLKAPENETSIMEHWIYTDKVYISCICITYNQENYIKNAIDGMLAQITDYQFEIIIHDDKSTDSTREIILEYKKKYPTLIKLILQDENQYQKGKKITPLATSQACGEYISLCEGDDYWIDQFKLQKQINELILNPRINLVITQSLSLDHNRIINRFCDLGKTKKHISFSNCVLGPSIDFYPTATFFFRKKIMLLLPNWFYTIAPVGDYYIQLFSSYNQGCIYLPDITSVYRRNSIGSWSSLQSIDKSIQDCNARILCNKLLIEQLKLTYSEVSALRKKESMYYKDNMILFIKKKKYLDSISNIIKGFINTPFYFSSLIFTLIKGKIKL